MHSQLHQLSSFARFKAASIALLITGGLFFSSCATTSTSEPDPARTTTTETEAEFYTPAPSGNADDYWLFYEDEDDTEYSYYLDEDHYYYVIQDEDDSDDDEGKKKWKSRYRRGHGYGDHNHYHVHWKKKSKKGGRHIHIEVRRRHWSDSLQLTSEQKPAIDTAMKQFNECAKETLDSFKVAFKPFRDEFRAEKMRILQLMNADSITRDSAYVLLDSAIERYEDQTDFLKAGLQVELQSCYEELDAFMRTRLTPVQYEIWVRNRGW
jgi:hypothetical protein